MGAEDHTAVAVWKSLPEGKCVCGQRHAVCCKVTHLLRKVGCEIAQSASGRGRVALTLLQKQIRISDRGKVTCCEDLDAKNVYRFLDRCNTQILACGFRAKLPAEDRKSQSLNCLCLQDLT